MKINYLIGRYWDERGGNVCAYTYWNRTVFYDEEEEAFEFAKRISEREGQEYRVFRLFDVGRYYDPDPC